MTLSVRRLEAIEPGIVARVARPAPPIPIIPLSWLFGAAIASCAAVQYLLVRSGLSLWMGSQAFDCACAVAFAVLLTLHGSRGARDGWRRTCNEATTHAVLFALLCLAGAVAAYPVAAWGTAYRDAAFHRADTLLGFDWFAWYRFVAAHRWAQAAGRVAYLSIFATPAALIVGLAHERRTAEARRFLTAFWLAAVLTLAIAAWLPLRGPMAMIDAAHLPYMPVSGVFQSELPPELRLHTLKLIDLLALHGLVGAPSFHTVSAVLYAAAAWRSRTLRWPILVVNAAMLAATPVEGTHYLVDMLMGAAVAALSLALVDAGLAAVARRRLR